MSNINKLTDRGTSIRKETTFNEGCTQFDIYVFIKFLFDEMMKVYALC